MISIGISEFNRRMGSGLRAQSKLSLIPWILERFPKMISNNSACHKTSGLTVY